MDEITGIAIGGGRDFFEFRPGKAQHILLFLRLGLRDHDDRAIAFGIADQGQTDAGVPGRAFDNDAARFQGPGSFRVFDDGKGSAILHGPARIGVFGLA